MIKLLFLIVSISAFAIVPGSSREDLSSSVLKIQFSRFGFKKGGLCTATAIGKYKVLTAGHCVKSYVSHIPRFLKLQVNNYGHAIKHISVPKGYMELQARYDASLINKRTFTLIIKELSKIDVAIITLSKPLRTNIKLTNLSSKRRESNEALLCGYGYSLFENDDYSQNSAANLLCGNNQYYFKNDLLFIKGNLINASYSESLTAPGDSGSPLFDKNMNQVGVLSGITKNTHGDATSYYADILNMKKFIDTNI